MNQEPYRNHIAITASDTALSQTVDAVFAAGAGTLVMTDRDGTAVTYTVPAGAIIPVQCTKVAAASTATGIVGLIY